MQRSKALAFAALIAVLVVGGAVGFTVDRLVHGSCSTTSRRNVDILADRLSLSAAQRAAVDSILDKRHRDFETALVPVRPKLDSIRLAARAEIFKLLDPTQHVRFQQMIDESQSSQENRR
ncbi:MAG TPA: hypothetical protein VGR59_00985 [Gemmatimonadaceae bacterium]|nr:hypothetical protein [Gemmatimonadaceae bacterium]